MSSSPIDTGLAPQSFGLRRPNLLKRALPRTLLGRSLLIIVTPLIVVQIIAMWVFYDRHWETVSRRLAGAVAGEVAFVVDALAAGGDPETLFPAARQAFELGFSLDRRGTLPGEQASDDGFITQQLAVAIADKLRRPFVITAAVATRDYVIHVALPGGVLRVETPRKRLYTFTTYLVTLWMVGSSIVLFAVATVFMRNQVRAVRRLAAAAEGFGKGRYARGFKPEGASEIRQAGAAFLLMRDRIQRQIRQRTEMLAGVSHDLRTPLTRMKLALEFLPGDAVTELKEDLTEMERMIEGYLDFMRGEGSEAPVPTDLAQVLTAVAAAARRGAPAIEIALRSPATLVLPLRPDAMRRCLTNLVSNACRHARQRVTIGVTDGAARVELTIDDDGPGIAPEQREAAFRPFVRLDSSRNAATGGVGLGLTIARDIARSHGGDVLLEAAPTGGARARITLPR